MGAGVVVSTRCAIFRPGVEYYTGVILFVLGIYNILLIYHKSNIYRSKYQLGSAFAGWRLHDTMALPQVAEVPRTLSPFYRCELHALERTTGGVVSAPTAVPVWV